MIRSFSFPARRFLSLLIVAIFLTQFISAQTIKGKVLDAATGEPLVGGTVKIDGVNLTTFVKLDGTFILNKIPAGNYAIAVSYEGYLGIKNEVAVTANATQVIDFNLEPTSIELSSVTISSFRKEEDNGARRLEKTANPILNVLSAKTIQLLPDITVANALQRVSGVTIERSSSGEGRYPIIRGMEKRYINTLVNGIKIPSPDNKNRYIPLDLFPSELLERLEVSKSLTPSMEGDAIGGTINLVMKDAPAKTLLQANFSLGSNNIFRKQHFQEFDNSSMKKSSPSEINGNDYTAVPSDFSLAHLNYNHKRNTVNSTFGLTYGDRFGKDKNFGFIVSASYQNSNKDTRTTLFLLDAQPALNNMPQFVELQSRQYSLQSQRTGINTKLDYRLNGRNKISWFNTFVRLSDYQSRLISDTIALNSLLDFKSRSTWQFQTIYNTTLQGIHQLASSIQIDWSLVYSIAKNQIPDQAEFTHEYPVNKNTSTGAYSAGSPDVLGGMARTWSRNSDKDYSAYLNFTDHTRFLGRKMEFKTGAVLKYKTRDNFYNTYSLKPQLPPGSSNQVYTTINNAIFVFNPVSAGRPSLNGNNYTFNENILDGYVQGKWQLTNKLEALGGVRAEYTHQHYETELGPEVKARSGKIWYTDILPGIQLKYAVSKNQNLRLAYYKALARPGFAELIPDGPDGESFKELGNPQNLKHTTADNIDLRYELFPGGADQVLFGVFYKNIKDPIEYSAVKTGPTTQSLIPSNFGTATNYGLEAVITKYFGVFGISANYTFTQSKITTDKLYSYRNSSGQITSKIQPETRPLQGQSNHIGNLSLIYKNPRIGFDFQAAFIYTGERISLVSPYAGLDYWQAPISQLDLSFEKRIIKKFSFYGKINNLTNSPLILEIHQSYDTYVASSGSRPLSLQTDPATKIVVQKDHFKTAFLLGARYKF